MITYPNLIPFVADSLHLSGIGRAPTQAELQGTEDFLGLLEMSIEDIERLVKVYAPYATLRDKPGITSPGRSAPPSGPKIRGDLWRLVEQANENMLLKWDVYCQFQLLHPFTDGNGRVGRALWLWMHRHADVGFLQAFHDQTLSNYRPPEER